MEAKGTKTKKRVGVLRGGTGENYHKSLKRGGEIIAFIFENLGDTYKVSDILVDKDYVWHFGGVPINPGDLVGRVDIIWNTAHPSFAGILDSLAIPNLSVSAFATQLEDKKDFMRDNIRQLGIQMPRSIVLPLYQRDFDGPRDRYSIKKAKEVFEKFPSPWLVKSLTPDSAMGIHIAQTFPELASAIEDGLRHERSILVEEFISGKIATMHSLPGYRGEDLYTFPLDSDFGHFSDEEKETLSGLSRNLHKHLGAEHYLKSDFVLSPHGRVYLLSLSGIPNLKDDSHFLKMCQTIGAAPSHVVEHMLESAL